MIIKNFFVEKNDEFSLNELETINGIENLINRTEIKLKEQGISNEIIESIVSIKNQKAKGLKDALQRILFFNQIMWQTGHHLNGLGRLDFILEDYYNYDIKNNILTKDECIELIKEFLLELHRFYKYKSNSLIGDTGQVIILGGKKDNGEYFYNDLTYMFIECIKQINLPDPKLLLRVNIISPSFV